MLLSTRWWRLDENRGWITQGQWQFGVPAGQGGSSHGHADPNAGATGANVYGVNLDGDYFTKVAGPYYLTTGAISMGTLVSRELRFKRWLNGDHQPYVSFTVECSPNGTAWTPVWTNGHTRIAENAWFLQKVDISSTDTWPTLYVRWGYQVHRVGTWAYSGWNIDDIQILATQP